MRPFQHLAARCLLVTATVCSLMTAPSLSIAAKAQAAEPAKPAVEQAAPAASAPAAAAPAASAAAPKAAEQVANPYGLDALWAQGDFVAKGTLIILVIMSMGTWYVMVNKLIEQQKMLRHGKAIDESFWKSSNLSGGMNNLHEDSPYRFLAETGVQATERHEGSLIGQIALNEWVAKSIHRATSSLQSQLQGGLAFLATVGSTAPFVGLFGTVWGIYHALTAIGIAGQASIDKVAGPVGEALIMTAIGLAVAVPAVLGYNWLVRRNKLVMEQLREFGDDLHSVLIAKAA